MSKPKYHVFICGQTRPEDHPRGSCGASGAGAVFQAFAMQLTSKKLLDSTVLTQSSCLGPCHLGANVLIYPEGIMYSSIKPEDVDVIIEQHFIKGEPVVEKFAPADVWS